MLSMVRRSLLFVVCTCACTFAVLAVVPWSMSRIPVVPKPMMYVPDDQSVDAVLSGYRARRVEAMNVSRPRSLVCVLDDRLGFANKMMHISSCVAFSILTDRALHFDWDEYTLPTFLYVCNMLIFGEDMWSHSSYDSLFQTFFTDVRTVGRDLQPMGPTNTFRLEAGMAADTPGHLLYEQGMELLAKEDLDETFKARTLYVKGWNFWCKPLFSNPRYQGTALVALGAERFFAASCRAVFRPRFHVSSPLKCGWVLQYRAHQAYYATAHLKSFEQCARQNGFDSARGGFNVLISDSHATVEGFQSLEVGCRTGFHCDVEAIRQMYLASTCENAVLTSMSTFGQVAAAMGNATNVWMVRADGACVRKQGRLPDNEE